MNMMCNDYNYKYMMKIKPGWDGLDCQPLSKLIIVMNMIIMKMNIIINI